MAHDRTKPHWLYRLFDANGTLLYVGQTHDPVSRFQGWFSRAAGSHRYAWFRDVVRVDWLRYPDYPSVVAAEKRAIEVEGPRHNLTHRPTLVAR